MPRHETQNTERRTAALRLSYTLLAPFYDWFAGPAFVKARRQSLAVLPRSGRYDILLDGIGTGLDIPHLPAGHRYVGLDLTRGMIERAVGRLKIGAGPETRLELDFIQADSLSLPFRDGCFDYIVLHLLLAVVPDAAAALGEAKRVLKCGGTLLVLDKFLKPGARAPVRRLLNPLAARIATRTDVIFDDVLAMVPGLTVASDEPALAAGWFRRIQLVKN